MLITSKQNTTYKLWNKLKLKKYRDLHDLFLVYGPHLIEEAKKHQVLIHTLTSNETIEGAIHLSKELMDGLQQAETYFDLIGVCKKKNEIIESNKILILDDIQDPDNLGALLRSASAFGFMHIILSQKSADVYNEKSIRASKGALFDLYIERVPLINVLSELKNKGYHLIYADAHDQGENKSSTKLALILGNEGHGVSKDIKDMCDQAIHIPIKNVESLNVSVAGAILMYEWRDL